MDCTVFFEVYHASRQSFLYLKEFYIGELDEDDWQKISIMNSNDPNIAKPSEAFLEQLNRITSWRMKKEDILAYEKELVHKSF